MSQAQIKRQVEFYFSLDNYPYDTTLSASVDADGYVPTKLLLKFNRIKMLTTDVATISAALVESDVVEVSQDGAKLRRRDPVPPNFQQLLIERSIAVLGIPEGVGYETIKGLFSDRGYVVTSVKLRATERNAAVAFSDPNMAQNAAKEVYGDIKVMPLAEYHSMKRGSRKVQIQSGKKSAKPKRQGQTDQFDSFLTLKNAHDLPLPLVASVLRGSLDLKLGTIQFCEDGDSIRIPMFESDVKKILKERPSIVIQEQELMYVDVLDGSVSMPRPLTSGKTEKQEKEQGHTLAPFPESKGASAPENPMQLSEFIGLVRVHVEPLLASFISKVLGNDTATSKLWDMRPDYTPESQYNPYDIRVMLKLIRNCYSRFKNSLMPEIERYAISELIELFNDDAHSKDTTTEEARARGYALYRMVKELPSVGIEDPDGVSTILYCALQRMYVGSERVCRMSEDRRWSKAKPRIHNKKATPTRSTRYLYLSNAKGVSISSIIDELRKIHNVKAISVIFVAEAVKGDIVRVELSAKEFYDLSSKMASIKVGDRMLYLTKRKCIVTKPGSIVWFANSVGIELSLLSRTVSSMIGSDVTGEILKSGRGVRIDCGTEKKAEIVREAGKLNINGQVVPLLDSHVLRVVFLEGLSTNVEYGDLQRAYMRHQIEFEKVVLNSEEGSARLVTFSIDDSEKVLALGKINGDGFEFSGPYSSMFTLILYPVPEPVRANDVMAVLKKCLGTVENIKYFSSAVDEVITMKLSSPEDRMLLLKRQVLNVNGFEIRIAHRQAKSVRDCVFGRHCRDFECGCVHPPNRVRICHEIHCKKPSCSLLHPADSLSLESQLLRFQSKKTHNMWTNIMKMLEARSNHMVKLEAAASNAADCDLQIMSAFGRDREILMSTREAHMATVDELIAQMKCFDDAVSSALQNCHDWDMLSERIARETFRLNNSLPALSKRNAFTKLVKDKERFIIVQGATGSGKSTQLPQYLQDIDGMREPPLVICTQPRSMAAIALAERAGFEYSGGRHQEHDDWSRVGYAVGLDHKITPTTTLIYASESEFLRCILEYDEANDHGALKRNSFSFSRVNFLVIDEAHERSIDTDILLGIFRNPPYYLKHIQVIVTSATLDTSLFCDFFKTGGRPAPLLDIPGRLFPVDIQYVGDGFQSRNLVKSVLKEILRLHRNGTEGDILCFLPSRRDVDTATSDAQVELGDDALCLPLYGQMERREQMRVFRSSNRRKIIFSTNVAETSITINGIRIVIDSGLCKEMVYEGSSGKSALRETSISKSSAIQRAGRAGRTAAGTCIRLYSRNDFESWPVAKTSDIVSIPLNTTILKLAKFRMQPSMFSWIEPPPTDAMAKAEETLLAMDAIHIEDGDVKLSRIGEVASSLELEPSHALAILTGCSMGIGESAVLICAVAACSTNFWKRDNREKEDITEEAAAEGDLIMMFKKYKERKEAVVSNREKRSIESGIRYYAFKNVGDFVSRTLRRIRDPYVKMPEWSGSDQSAIASSDQLQLLASICCFPNVGVLVGKNRYITPGTGTVAKLSYSSVVGCVENLPEMIMYGQFIEIGGTNLIDTATPTTMNILKHVSLSFHDNILKKRQSWPSREVVVRNISPAISARLIGKQCIHLAELERKLKCGIHFDPAIGKLSFFTTNSAYEEKRRAIHEVIDGLRHKLETELKEEELCGETHALFAAGGVIEKCLFSGDSVSVRLNGLPKNVTIAEIRSVLKQKLKIQPNDIEVVRNGGMALLTFQETLHAREAVDILQGEYLLGDRMMSAELGKLLSETIETARVGGMLQMTYANAPSLGKARIVFSLARDANELLKKHDVIFNGLYMGSGRCYPYDTKGIKEYDENTVRDSYPVFVHGIQNSVDEDELELRLRANNMFENVKLVFVYRETKPEKEGDSDPLFVQVSHLRSLIPFKDKIVSQTSFADNSRLRGSITVFYEDVHTCRAALDETKKVEIEPIFGQKVRFNALFQFRQVLHEDVFFCLKERIVTLFVEGKSHGARCRVEDRGRHLKVVKLESSSTQVLNLLRDKLATVLKTDSSFDHPHKELLFSRFARSQMQAIPASEGHIHWVNANQRIHIYGSETQKNAMKDKLAQLAEELSDLEIDKSIRLKLVSSTTLDPNATKDEFELLNVTRRGQNLLVTGESEKIAALITSLKESRSMVISKGFRSTNECSLCGDSHPNTSFSICGHRYCRECIEPMFEQSDVPLPFRCPAIEGCGKIVSWGDILALSDSSTVAKIKEKAMITYARDHANEIVSCPMNCGQHFPTPGRLTVDQQREFGGRVVHCDQCLQSWCLDCSDAEAAPEHIGNSCDDQRRFMNPDIAAIVGEIRDKVLTLHCTSCDAAFLDFTGCTSLECWSCKRWFCGWCLVDCGNDAHPHVRQCALNPRPGEYFASFEIWDNFHKIRKRRGVIERIRLIGIRQKQMDVLESLKVDLTDLGIEIRDSDI